MGRGLASGRPTTSGGGAAPGPARTHTQFAARLMVLRGGLAMAAGIRGVSGSGGSVLQRSEGTAWG